MVNLVESSGLLFRLKASLILIDSLLTSVFLGNLRRIDDAITI